MLTLRATLLNIYTSNEYRNPETGEVISEAKIKLQLMTNRKMKNGSIKQELLDITLPKEKLPLYENKVGKDVDVSVGIISKQYSFYGI
jgi:hypothetical protein